MVEPDLRAGLLETVHDVRIAASTALSLRSNAASTALSLRSNAATCWRDRQTYFSSVANF